MKKIKALLDRAWLYYKNQKELSPSQSSHDNFELISETLTIAFIAMVMIFDIAMSWEKAQVIIKMGSSALWDHWTEALMYYTPCFRLILTQGGLFGFAVWVHQTFRHFGKGDTGDLDAEEIKERMAEILSESETLINDSQRISAADDGYKEATATLVNYIFALKESLKTEEKLRKREQK